MRYLLPFAAIVLLLASCSAPPRQPQRYGSVIGLKDDKAEEYKRLHQVVWPDVMKAVRDANIRNYSIYLHRMPDGNLYLFTSTCSAISNTSALTTRPTWPNWPGIPK